MEFLLSPPSWSGIAAVHAIENHELRSDQPTEIAGSSEEIVGGLRLGQLAK
jgi:hypothetical protein